MQIELSPHIAQAVLSSNFSLEMRAIQSIFKQGQFADYMRKPQAAFCRLFEELGHIPSLPMFYKNGDATTCIGVRADCCGASKNY